MEERKRSRKLLRTWSRPSGSFDRSTVECFNCHEMRHFQYECPLIGNETKANIAETREELLLMAYVEDKGNHNSNTWYLDSGCNNHLSGNKELFSNLDEQFRENVNLGNDSHLRVQGKCDVRIQINGVVQIITGVFYVPELKSNLISLGQLQEKGFIILIQYNSCQIHPPKKSLLL